MTALYISVLSDSRDSCGLYRKYYGDLEALKSFIVKESITENELLAFEIQSSSFSS